MKPRRENGATFVSPMTSDVSMGSALMMDFLWRVLWLRSSPHPCSKPAREGFGESVRDQSHTGIIDFQASFESESRKKGGAARRVSGNRIQQAIAAERKSPACEDAAGTGAEAFWGGRATLPQEKNKAVSAVYRKRPCQPRTLKS